MNSMEEGTISSTEIPTQYEGVESEVVVDE